ncbi:hypothetical protein [Pseudomonas sp. NW5]|uniref:hypothetical protein n=1 Tax=Pseudomonas sp. NW5 TaxID=2934934 RepID=UPI002021E9E5|nr:hypothetical protein [Pseudomonas sp. NW5]MCL7463312.1 hypothetical protein [Pseudomonas sp. NW5]
MGKKSREKRERRLARMEADHGLLLQEMLGFHGKIAYEKDQGHSFRKRLEATRALLRQYERLDAAIALSVSELWLANAGSPIKHIFAWGVLLDLPHDDQGGMPIASYADFKAFAEALYEAWPEFPMLEDFSSEADWGETKVRLGQAFVPMFYGSCIERTPDFVEAFRITYAQVPEAQAHMDLAIALQARIIESMLDLGGAPAGESQQAHVEVPPEDFWLACRLTLQQIGTDIADWRDKARGALDTRFGAFKAPLTWRAFGDAVMQGVALPFLAVESDGTWVPMSARNAPGVVVDHWANNAMVEVGAHTHRRLALFVAERFPRTVVGPLALVIGGSICEELPISCVISANSGVYLICACDHASNERLSIAAKDVYGKVRRGAPIHFRLADGRGLMLSKDGTNGPSADELRIVIVVTQAGTALGSISAPERPARLLPLADFITIFDSLSDLDELECYWEFVDSQRGSLSLFSSGPADLYASFKDTNGVLVEGAISPTLIGLDPHWGTSWRFKALADFWSRAPSVFPDGSVGWRLTNGTKGVVDLKSRHHKAVAYSTSVGSCTVQTLVEVSEGLRIEDARMVDLFAQLLADCTYRCRELISDIPLFRQPHVLFICWLAPSSSVGSDEAPQPIEGFERVVISAEENAARKGILHLQVDARAVLAGLNAAKDGSFEVRCLLETLERCHAVCGLELPIGLGDRLRGRASEPARYHLRVAARNVDVPDYVEPVIPSPANYKLARKHLAAEIMALGLTPGRYELSDAKARIDPAGARLRLHIENRLASLDRYQLLRAFIEQHDALLVTERMKIQRTRQSLSHDVDYDRLDAIEQARKDYGSVARHYRYLLEKTVSSPTTGTEDATDDVLRELVGLVDWYMVLTGASDVLHNGIDVGGVVIDDSYIPEVFYSTGADDREAEFAREYAKSRLGLGVNSEDAVEGASEDLLSSERLKSAFAADVGFDLQNLVTALAVLSQAQRYGFGDELSLSYSAPPSRVAQGLADSIEMLDFAEAERIVTFLTLSEKGVRRLSGRSVDEIDVPYWEHSKRIHRYAIRPLVVDGTNLRWGAEAVSRSMYNWMSAVRDGYLPADFDWPHVQPVIREVKESIENRLELRTEEIFLRHTPFVHRGIDFFRKFRGEGFEDVGDFDVFAYWPDANLLVTVECKYNQPPYTVKDGRRLRDRIFGKAEDDKAGQFSRILRRRQFLEKNRARTLELLKWPKSEAKPFRHVELYVSRDVYYWMVHPPYPVPTKFVRVDTLDTWIKTELITSRPHV